MNKDLCQDSPEQSESKGSGSSSLPKCQSGLTGEQLYNILNPYDEASYANPARWDQTDDDFQSHYDRAAQAVRNAVIEECFHKEQLQIWANELLADLDAYGYIKAPASYDDVVHMHKVIEDFLNDTVAARLRSLKGSRDNEDT
jgi:hypothetical protein